MKTNLAQQLALINALEKEPSKPLRVKMLRDFLHDNGYEETRDCKHYTINRLTGNCASCTARVQQPMPFDSDEALSALKARLRD